MREQSEQPVLFHASCVPLFNQGLGKISCHLFSQCVRHIMWVLHSFITWALVGFIWHVQLVQYPLFLQVGQQSFPRYHAEHCMRISFVVVPLILLEAATGLWLLWQGPQIWYLWAGFILFAIVWGSTFLVQVPLHDRLAAHGWNDRTIRRLVLTNWIRTSAWTARGLLLLWLWWRAGLPNQPVPII